MDIKKLTKLYEEYKKIGQPAGYDKGGDVKKPEHNQKNLKKLNDAFGKFIKEEGGEKGYADGGEVDESPVRELEGMTLKAENTPDEELPADYSDEDKDAEKKVDQKKALDEEIDKELEDQPQKDKKDSEEKDEDTEPSSEQPSDEEKQDIATSEYSGKAEGIEPPKSNPGDPNDLAKAQKQRQATINSNKDLQLGNLIGSGIAGRSGAQVDPLPASYFQSLNAGAGLPVQNIQEQIGNQKNDPNSNVSKAMNEYLTSKGFNLPLGTSAADAEAVMPFLQKDQGYQNALDIAIKKQEGANSRTNQTNSTKADIADKNVQAANDRADKRGQTAKDIETSREKSAMDRAKVSNEGRVNAAKAGLEAKTTKGQNDDAIKAEADTQNARSKPAVQIAQRNGIAIKNAMKMFDEFPNPDKWTPAQVNLFNLEMAKVAGGQAPTESMIHDLSNPTAASALAGLMQKITNVPVGAQQGEFIALNKKYLQGLADVSNNVIKDNVGNNIKAHQSKLGPDQYKKLLYRHSDALGLLSPGQENGVQAVMKQKGLSREDAISGLVKNGDLKDLNY